MDTHCINLCSVKSQATCVADLVISHDIDILAFAETRLGSVVDIHLIAQVVPDGYKFHTLPRSAQKRDSAVDVIYKSGLKVENVSNR